MYSSGETAEGRYIVPYAIQDTVPSSNWQQIHDELDDFTLAMGCVEFVYDPEFSYEVGVHITGDYSGGDGCWSYVGVSPGKTGNETNIHSGWQALRLPSDCILRGGIQHEFLHAIGFMHEQDRPDYLDYIEDREDAGGINASYWVDTGHPFEPASNVMYPYFRLLNGRSYRPHSRMTTTDAEQDQGSKIPGAKKKERRTKKLQKNKNLLNFCSTVPIQLFSREALHRSAPLIFS